MKVISNHVLDHRIIMTPNSSSSDRSWVWTAFDFAEGELLETVSSLTVCVYMYFLITNGIYAIYCGYLSG
jgi:hypothetical protein